MAPVLWPGVLNSVKFMVLWFLHFWLSSEFHRPWLFSLFYLPFHCRGVRTPIGEAQARSTHAFHSSKTVIEHKESLAEGGLGKGEFLHWLGVPGMCSLRERRMRLVQVKEWGRDKRDAQGMRDKWMSWLSCVCRWSVSGGHELVCSWGVLEVVGGREGSWLRRGKEWLNLLNMKGGMNSKAGSELQSDSGGVHYRVNIMRTDITCFRDIDFNRIFLVDNQTLLPWQKYGAGVRRQAYDSLLFSALFLDLLAFMQMLLHE